MYLLSVPGASNVGLDYILGYGIWYFNYRHFFWFIGGYIKANYQNLKIPLRPKAMISGKKASLSKINADFFQYKNTPSFIKTMTLDEREHVF